MGKMPLTVLTFHLCDGLYLFFLNLLRSVILDCGFFIEIFIENVNGFVRLRTRVEHMKRKLIDIESGEKKKKIIIISLFLVDIHILVSIFICELNKCLAYFWLVFVRKYPWVKKINKSQQKNYLF